MIQPDLFDFGPGAVAGAAGIDYEADSPDTAETSPEEMDAKMGRVSIMALRQLELEQAVIQAEAELKRAKKDLAQLAQSEFPDLLRELSLSKVVLNTGHTVEFTETLYASIPAKNKHEAAEWLIAHGYEALVQTTIALSFDRGDGDKPQQAIAVLHEHGFQDVEQAENMNTTSVKAVLNSLREAGEDVPLTLFGANIVSMTKIKQPKTR